MHTTDDCYGLQLHGERAFPKPASLYTKEELLRLGEKVARESERINRPPRNETEHAALVAYRNHLDTETEENE